MIDLADGELIKPEHHASVNARPSTILSRRSDVPTNSAPRSRASSLESTVSVAARQHEMLRRVFAASASDEKKGASLPSRALSRPTLADGTDQQSVPTLAEAALSAPKGSLALSPGRHASFRFRRLISRLRSKPTREIAAEPSSLDRSTPSASSDTKTGRGAGSDKDSDGEDWDCEFGFSDSVKPDEMQPFDLDGKLGFTSEGIPHLLAKATELRQACLRELALLQT